VSIVAASFKGEAAEIQQQLVTWRRHLHQNPELSFEEVNTSQFIFDTLSSFDNLEISRPTKTSVVARLISGQPGKVLAIRADMDALPILEENSFDFVSQKAGVMHACGHDGHTAMLLGAAKILSERKDELCGEVRFLFQHAEELFPGGAQQMVEAGVMEGVDCVIGAHLWAGLPVGKIGVAAGPLMAAPDTFHITIQGKGGHAAHPNETVDSIAIAAQVVTNLQHVVSRNTDPLKPIVLSVTQFAGGTAHNIIPGTVELSGTVRTFDATLRTTVPALMERIIGGVTAAHGGRFTLNYEQGYRAVINDEAVTAVMEEVLIDTFGADVVVKATPTMGGEDFSAFQQKAPGTFFFVGAGKNDEGTVYPHHHPRFTVDEAALPLGVQAFVNAALRILKNSD